MVLTNEFVKAQERESEKQVVKTKKKTLAFVVYPGISLLELVGNRTLLGDIMKLKAGYEPVVVGAGLEAIPTDTPLSIIPQKTFAEVPNPEGLIVIGGGADAITALDN